MIAAAVDRLPATRPGGRALRVGLRWLPLAAVLILVQARGDRAIYDPWREWRAAGAGYRHICSLVDPDALVVSDNPWWFHLWCGNAGLRIPVDLHMGRDTLNRYLDEQQPGCVFVHLAPKWDFLYRSQRLERIATVNRQVLYEVVGAGPASRTWRAPPPLGRFDGDPAR